MQRALGRPSSSVDPKVPVRRRSGPDEQGKSLSARVGKGREYFDVPEPNILREFAETGIVRFHAAFSSTTAEQMTNAVWAYAERKAGICRDDPDSRRDRPLGFSWKGLKRNPAFNHLVDNDAVRTALDALFGPSQWLQPNPGAQNPPHAAKLGSVGAPRHLAHGLWVRAALMARERGKAVRFLRRGGAEGWWHDGPAWHPPGG